MKFQLRRADCIRGLINLAELVLCNFGQYALHKASPKPLTLFLHSQHFRLRLILKSNFFDLEYSFHHPMHAGKAP